MPTVRIEEGYPGAERTEHPLRFFLPIQWLLPGRQLRMNVPWKVLFLTFFHR